MTQDIFIFFQNKVSLWIPLQCQRLQPLKQIKGKSWVHIDVNSDSKVKDALITKLGDTSQTQSEMIPF